MVALLALLSLATAVSAAPSPMALSTLFKRDDQWFNGTAVGSDEWKALYPATNATPSWVPQPWLDALCAAETAGLLPDPAVNPVGILNKTSGLPSYGGLNASGPGICSVSYGCYGADDVVNAPDGYLTIAFDDGPDKGSPSLYSYLSTESISATHFLIGRQIIANSSLLLQLIADPTAQHLAVHTWTHPYMTTLSNEGVVAEIGWTMQLIADLNGGKIPGWWRPPFGDVDDRVRAIAKEVFGLQTVIWNHDVQDWKIDNSTFFESDARANIQKFSSGPKVPGLLMLEHELSTGSAGAFIAEYPTFREKGWETGCIPDVFGQAWYKNAFDDVAEVDESIGIVGAETETSA